METRARSGRIAIALTGALVTVATALALPRSAEPAAGGGQASAAAPAVKVEVLRTNQRAILATGKLKVRVTKAGPGALKLKARAQAGAGPSLQIAKTKRMRFNRARTKRIRLKLNRRGRELLGGCSASTLTVRAKLGRAGRGAGATARTDLVLDAVRCGAVTPPRGTPGGGTPGGTAPGGGDPGGGDPGAPPDPTPYTGPPINTSAAGRCDVLDPAICLQPFPNNHFTVADPATDSGRRVNFQAASMPKNQPLSLPLPLIPIDPTDHNRGDGFSPGSMLITRVRGLDNPEAFEETGAVSIDRPDTYDDPDQPILVINADTGERHPVFAEIDFNPIDPANGAGDTPANRAKVNLIIRPLVNFEEGERYVVALRDLKDEDGNTIEPANSFRIYRDNLTTQNPAIEKRRPLMEELFGLLGDAGIQRSNLNLTWDFTVASERSISERMLSIRDQAFSQLGDDDLADGAVAGSAPAFTIDAVREFTPEQDSLIAREVDGTITVPCFMKPNCGPVGATYNLGPDGLPAQTGNAGAAFHCEIPRAALDDPEAPPARASLYGHGLLGAATEVRAGNVKSMANEHNFVFCATDWYGFAEQNLINILLILQDLSRFNTLVDPTQQGFLNFLFLGRAMIHADGLIDDPAFQSSDGDPLLDTGELFYDGNSQGGILGGSLTALAPDFRQAVLGVPGMNYSTLLRRSVDFEPYAEGVFGPIIEDLVCDQFNALPVPELAAILVPLCAGLIPDDTPLGLYDNYPNELERPLILSLMQMLWDRGEANGYAHHMTTDPLPNTPPHEVLLHPAFGDHQVANLAAEVEARTIGASVYQPALDPGRHWEADGSEEIFGLPAIGSFPFDGSALVYWDGGPLGFSGGAATQPNENIPPRPPEFGADPHSYPRSDVKGRAQKSAFLSPDGVLRNPCTTTNNLASPPLPIAFENGDPIPCYSHGWLGPPAP